MDAKTASARVAQLKRDGHQVPFDPEGRDFQLEFYEVLEMLHRRATLADRWRARRAAGHWINRMDLDPDDDPSAYRRDFYAVLSMLERRATFLDRALARWRPKHWLNSARLELLVEGKR